MIILNNKWHHLLVNINLSEWEIRKSIQHYVIIYYIEKTKTKTIIIAGQGC